MNTIYTLHVYIQIYIYIYIYSIHTPYLKTKTINSICFINLQKKIQVWYMYWRFQNNWGKQLSTVFKCKLFTGKPLKSWVRSPAFQRFSISLNTVFKCKLTNGKPHESRGSSIFVSETSMRTSRVTWFIYLREWNFYAYLTSHVVHLSSWVRLLCVPHEFKRGLYVCIYIYVCICIHESCTRELCTHVCAYKSTCVPYTLNHTSMQESARGMHVHTCVL